MSTEIHVRTIITDYNSHADEIRRIRNEVFLVEQAIDPADEYDDRDEACVWALSFIDNEAVGTGRLDVEKNGKIGRVAVLVEHRRCGVGRRMMAAFEDYARQSGELNKIWFHAQRSAVPFYLALDYSIESEEFMEADIPHVVMEKKL